MQKKLVHSTSVVVPLLDPSRQVTSIVLVPLNIKLRYSMYNETFLVIEMDKNVTIKIKKNLIFQKYIP
jgi:hypothetical protein